MATVSFTANAATIVADFNNLDTGILRGQAGGTGFSGNWLGSAAGSNPTTRNVVVAGNLTSANYTLTQSGTAQSVQSTDKREATDSQNYVALATPQTGIVWFSFLAQLTDAEDRVGFSLNVTGNTPGTGSRDADFILVGAAGGASNFRTRIGANSVTNATSLSIGTTYLVLARININATGNDALDVWFNPNLTSYTSESQFLGAVTPSYSIGTADWVTGSSISNIGVFSYNNGATNPDGGIIDAIRMSNDSDAFFQVTGVIPEPGTSMLLLGGLGMLALRRRATSRRK